MQLVLFHVNCGLNIHSLSLSLTNIAFVANEGKFWLLSLVQKPNFFGMQTF